MSPHIDHNIIAQDAAALENHPVYVAVNTLQDLRIFMQHHVYSVWDFMSLIKYLQNEVAPARYPWLPGGDSDVRRFINELVLEEESDESGADDGGFSSHFELYCGAMAEIGADNSVVLRFLDRIRRDGINSALVETDIPEPSRHFTRTTFDFIESGKPHTVAAALALGREHIIPCMFRSLLDKIGVSAEQAPTFYYYLNRHIHLDEDFHAPLSLRLLNALCGEDEIKKQEAIAAARQALDARKHFWDGVLDAIESNRLAA